MYIWERPDWPEFKYDIKSLIPSLDAARARQSDIKGTAAALRLEDLGELIFTEVLDTSLIEGEQLNPQDVRSSVARRLGLSEKGLPDTSERHGTLVDVLLDATRSYRDPLTPEKLFAWHAGLFPTGYSGMFKVKTASWRQGTGEMNIVSGNPGKEKVHFTAPPASRIPAEMERFLEWWNESRALDGLLRAGMAHLYFVTIHPFEDGNGRIARALTDLALAQDEQNGTRLYSLSSQILRDKSRYYTLLEETQKGDGDITAWLLWFLKTYSAGIDHSLLLVRGAFQSRAYYSRLQELDLNERQKKVLDKMIALLPGEFHGGMTNKKYTAITGTSPATSKRDLTDLAVRGVLVPGDKGGRSAYYVLNREWMV